MPVVKAGQRKELNKVFAQLKIDANSSTNDAAWVTATSENNSVELTERKMINGAMPDVSGMGARDAIYLLENEGLNVRISGKGVVIRQSIEPGTRIQKGQQILIELI
jgi:cell division protein FtsI (penicillin-binding protein 3)